jgi:hypothetical protein
MKKKFRTITKEVLVPEKVTYHWDLSFLICTQHKKLSATDSTEKQ